MVSAEILSKIKSAVAEAESKTSCEIKVAIENSLSIWEKLWGWTSRKRAEELFVKERVWDTELNNGILIYLLMKKHNLEIVADRGLSTKSDQEKWRAVCQQFEDTVKNKGFSAGVHDLIHHIGLYCAARYPITDASRDNNEVTDAIVIR